MDTKQTIRHEILFQLYGGRPGHRTPDRIARMARNEGEIPNCTPASVSIECEYLVGKGLISMEPDPIAQSIRRYAITSAGIDYLEAQELI